MDTRAATVTSRARPLWWGGGAHTMYTVVVFVVLASLDNSAIGILPPLYQVIARDLSVSEASVGVVTAVNLLVMAVASVMWGYWGDRGSRKRLLLYGTLIWALAELISGAARSYPHLLAAQAAAAIGLGCIASVGFSVVGDFIAPRRRGLVMSLWGLSQGIGLGGGILLSGLLGAANWRLPFFAIAGSGFGFAALFLFTYDPRRGRSEPELAQLFTSGTEYEYRVLLADVLRLATQRSNLWLLLQGAISQLAFGSLIWLPRLFAAKAEAQGYTLQMATAVGSLLAILFQVGGAFSVLGGYIGDRWQLRDLRGRAAISAIGILGAVPFYLVFLFLPLRGLDIPNDSGTWATVGGTLASLVTNPWVALGFLMGLGALALTSLASPNWMALINDVNLPEHRGTVFGLATLANGVGRAVGNGLTGVAFGFFALHLSTPVNYAVGLALFQLFFLPSAFCYYRATKTTPGHIVGVKRLLSARAEQASSKP